MHLIDCYRDQGLQKFSVKDQLSILDFSGHNIPITQLSYYNVKAAIDNKQICSLSLSNK